MAQMPAAVTAVTAQKKTVGLVTIAAAAAGCSKRECLRRREVAMHRRRLKKEGRATSPNWHHAIGAAHNLFPACLLSPRATTRALLRVGISRV
jgi:hypothetical protein